MAEDESNTKHTYTQSTYTGKMASGSPILSANFDTDPFQLSASGGGRARRQVHVLIMTGIRPFAYTLPAPQLPPKKRFWS